MVKVIVFAAITLLCLSTAAQADVFNLGSGLTNLETVTVGDAGNRRDFLGIGVVHGAVSYDYNIGKYEVTAAQYCDFLNLKAKADPYGLYNTGMANSGGCNIVRSGTWGNYTYSVASDWANRPVNVVSFWDACRFANWLSNGQGDGDTENGAYSLNGYNGTDVQAAVRNTNWSWAIASEDEWYKAAYYRGGGLTSFYYDYATKNNVAPLNDLTDPDHGNSATYLRPGEGFTYTYTIGSPYYRTEVGAHENSESAYGTFDQTGNVAEWTEGASGPSYWGGSFGDDWISAHDTRSGLPLFPTAEHPIRGFRVVQAVPEPSSVMALLAGLGGLVGLCTRRRGK